jgi:hypothetical protein
MVDQVEGSNGGLGLGLTPAEDMEIAVGFVQTFGMKIMNRIEEEKKIDNPEEE